MAELKIENLTARPASGKGLDNIFSNFSLTVPTGGICAILGGSGCGKSTLISCILDAKKDSISSGTVTFDNKTLSAFLKGGGEIGLATQDPLIIPFWNIRENIELIFKLRRKKITEDDNIEIDEMVKAVGLDELANKGKTAANLSGGEQKRLGFIRALCGSPKMLFLDEVFTGCDISLRTDMINLFLKKWESKGKPTTIIVTHNTEIAALLSTECKILKREDTCKIVDKDSNLFAPFPCGLYQAKGTNREYEKRCAELLSTCLKHWGHCTPSGGLP